MTANGCLPLAELKIHATAEMNDGIKKKVEGTLVISFLIEADSYFMQIQIRIFYSAA